MEYCGNGLSCVFDRRSKSTYQARVVVQKEFVTALYKQALQRHRKHVQAYGFARGTTPIAYLERTHRHYILDHVKEFFLNHCVINFLSHELCRQQAVVVGNPQLEEVILEPNMDAEFRFIYTSYEIPLSHEWKRCSFKAPSRRNYKDLDRQVETFIADEEQKRSTRSETIGISPADWVCFSVTLVDPEGKQQLFAYEDLLWIKIGKEDTDRESHELFLGHHLDDSFLTNSPFLQAYLSKQLDTDYLFLVTIKAIQPNIFFSLDLFKHHFGLRRNDEQDRAIRRRLIEVFSTRHDISLRRETIESAFKTLFKHYHIAITDELIREQEYFVLKAVQRTPDYPVYRLQKDFKSKIAALAEKQLKESLIIDYIASIERIALTSDDIRAYINLMQRPRTKEFIYFDLPPTHVNGQEQPIPAGIIHQSALREKTLNYVIETLAKRG